MNNMRRITVLAIAFISIILSACSSEQEKLYSEIKSYEKTLFKDDKGLNDSIAQLFVEKSDNYVNLYRDDANSPELLYKSGEILSGLGNYSQSIRRFQLLYGRYPKYNKRAESIFICGFIYDTYLQDTRNAWFHYNKFLKEYPNHKLAEDARASMSNLGKSPEELVKEFEMKEKGK